MNGLNEIDDIMKKETFNDTWKTYASFLCDNGIEFWKVINGFPNYEASTMGRVKVANSNRIGNNNVGLILKQEITDEYNNTTLTNDNTRTTRRVHILVALTFIPNGQPKIKTEVDHIDRNKQNNKIDNLRWCSHQENMNFYKETIEYKDKKIYQYDLNDNLIKEWNNLREILDANKEYKTDSFYHVLSGDLDKLYDYKWKYEAKEEIKLKTDEIFKKIGAYENCDYGNYELSNYGNIRNISRNNLLGGTIRDGHKEACLYDNITKKSYYVKIDKLVAHYFVNNKPEGKHIVMHKDNNKLNNKWDNLEWTSPNKLMEQKCGVKVKKMDINTGTELAVYDSIVEACRINNLDGNKRIAVSKCCRGVNKSAFGYKWEYVK